MFIQWVRVSSDGGEKMGIQDIWQDWSLESYHLSAYYLLLFAHVVAK